MVCALLANDGLAWLLNTHLFGYLSTIVFVFGVRSMFKSEESPAVSNGHVS
jgi:hypothetical protein